MDTGTWGHRDMETVGTGAWGSANMGQWTLGHGGQQTWAVGTGGSGCRCQCRWSSSRPLLLLPRNWGYPWEEESASGKGHRLALALTKQALRAVWAEGLTRCWQVKLPTWESGWPG